MSSLSTSIRITLLALTAGVVPAFAQSTRRKSPRGSRLENFTRDGRRWKLVGFERLPDGKDRASETQ